MKTVTYDNQTNTHRSKRAFNETKKSRELGSHSQNSMHGGTKQQRSDDVNNGSENIDRGTDDFVIDRESMNFKKVPSFHDKTPMQSKVIPHVNAFS